MVAEGHFQSDEEVIAAMDQDESFYITRIQGLQHHCRKLVERKGDYVEK